MGTLYDFLYSMGLLVLSTGGISAQQTLNVAEDSAYTKVIQQRADKILGTLNIVSDEKASRLRNIIANQYRNLKTIHDASDQMIKSVHMQGTLNKISKSGSMEAIENETQVRLDSLHTVYIYQLSVELHPELIEKVKDGMTYGVLPITYQGYLNMIPNLTSEQKEQIMIYLVEGREHAMDAGSSEKKHAWFGKYKGKINNYLSSAGYDMKKAGEDWEERRKGSADKSKK